MKILLINDNSSTQGGAEKYFYSLKEKLQQLPALDIFTLTFGDHFECGENFCTLKAAQSNMAKLLWRCFINPFVFFKIRKILNNFKPDIVHLHNIKQSPISLLSALRGYKVVQTVHDYSYLCPTAQNIHRDNTVCTSGIQKNCFWQHQVKFNKLLFLFVAYSFYKVRQYSKNIVAAFLTPSPLLADFMCKNGLQPATFVAPFIHKAIPLYSSPPPKTFLFAGNLGIHKGTKLLLNEFAIAAKKDTALHLIIAGSGPEESNMKAHAANLGIKHQVEFIGWQNDLSTHYQRATAVIFCSTGMESFGLVITEAMQHQRALIGINRGTSAWLIKDNYNGLLFNPAQTGDLANKILLLAENLALAEHLGKNAALTVAEHFDDDKALEQILTVYRSVI